MVNSLYSFSFKLSMSCHPWSWVWLDSLAQTGRIWSTGECSPSHSASPPSPGPFTQSGEKTINQEKTDILRIRPKRTRTLWNEWLTSFMPTNVKIRIFLWFDPHLTTWTHHLTFHWPKPNLISGSSLRVWWPWAWQLFGLREALKKRQKKSWQMST